MNTSTNEKGLNVNLGGVELGKKPEVTPANKIGEEGNINQNQEAPKQEFVKPNYNQKFTVPEVEVKNGSKFSDIVKDSNFAAIELSASKKDLVDFINRNIGIKSDTDFVPRTLNEFKAHLEGRVISMSRYTGNGLDNVEIMQLCKLFYPSANNYANNASQSIQGFFEVVVDRDDLRPKHEGNDLLELSTLDDITSLFRETNVKKFVLDGYRHIYYTNISTGKVHYFLPAVTIILAYFGFDVKATVRDYYTSLAETTNNIVVRIRK